MNAALIFLFSLFCILFFTVKVRLHPFLALISTSVLIGVAAGEPLGALEAISMGLGKVFSQYAVVITCGGVIGYVLAKAGGTSLIASDFIRFSRNPLLALNLLGFLFAVPLMCNILAYVIFISIARDIADKLNYPSVSTATSLALGTLASFNLVYPSPVIYSAAEEFATNTSSLFRTGFFIALFTSTAGFFYAKKFCNFESSLGKGSGSENKVSGNKGSWNKENSGAKPAEIGTKQVGEGSNPADGVRSMRKESENISRLEAYAPLLIPLLLILSRTIIKHPLFVFLGNPNIALLLGVLFVLFSGRRLGADSLKALIERGVKRSGVVLLDLCGGGALAATLTLTGAGQALGQLFMHLPVPLILIPFLVAVAFQSVQGSRVVTMIAAPALLTPILSGLPGEILVLSMASGTFLISHVNDPFFWIFGELADVRPAEVFRTYTLGGVFMGLVSFLLVCGVYFLFY